MAQEQPRPPAPCPRELAGCGEGGTFLSARLQRGILIRVTVKAKSHMGVVGVLAVSAPGPHHARRCSELLL
ncbi:unnamed protein product [Rangifer tarandus platyrhynchus]|uniref:Uncharacterized protein n=1 Tax=Rangifer tarandus platyrhynchus TaxID=3082113 RepID=A0AC59YHR9_RANTA